MPYPEALAGEKTAAQAIDSYLAWQRPAKDNLRYLSKLRQWFGDTPLRFIGQDELQEAAKGLYPGCLASTINRQVYTPMIAVLHHAGMPTFIRRPYMPKRHVKYVSRQVAEKLIHDAEDADLRALLVFLFFTGARISEALGLTPDRIDYQNGRVRLSLSKRKIDVWRPLHARAQAALRGLPSREDRVFRFRSRYSAERALNKLRRRTSIHFTFHMARHSFATWLADEGANLRDIMEAGGWSTLKSVLCYVGSDEKRVRSVIDRL